MTTANETTTTITAAAASQDVGRWCIKHRNIHGETEIETVWETREQAHSALLEIVNDSENMSAIGHLTYLVDDLRSDNKLLVWIEPFVPVPAPPDIATLQTENERLRALIDDAAAALEAVNDTLDKYDFAYDVANAIQDFMDTSAASVLARLRAATGGGA